MRSKVWKVQTSYKNISLSILALHYYWKKKKAWVVTLVRGLVSFETISYPTLHAKFIRVHVNTIQFNFIISV